MGKVKFKDLSFWLKISVILSFIIGTLYLILFLLGFIIGIIGAL